MQNLWETTSITQSLDSFDNGQFGSKEAKKSESICISFGYYSD